MKKLLLVLLTVLVMACKNTPSNEIAYFQNPTYVECNIPIIKTQIDSTEVCLILDTGANMSLIDSDWYRKNQHLVTYSRTIEIKYHGIGGSTEMQEVDVVVAKLPIGSVVFTESNLSSIKKQISEQGYNIIGIIGSDFFERTSAVIDYGNRALFFADLELDSLKLIKK